MPWINFMTKLDSTCSLQDTEPFCYYIIVSQENGIILMNLLLNISHRRKYTFEVTGSESLI